MGNSSKINIGIIGSGNIGVVHIKEFQKISQECEIIGITDVNLELAKSVAARNLIFQESSKPLIS